MKTPSRPAASDAPPPSAATPPVSPLTLYIGGKAVASDVAAVVVTRTQEKGRPGGEQADVITTVTAISPRGQPTHTFDATSEKLQLLASPPQLPSGSPQSPTVFSTHADGPAAVQYQAAPATAQMLASATAQQHRVVEAFVDRAGAEPLGCRLLDMQLMDVSADSPAVRAGISKFIGRRLTHVNGDPVDSVEEVGRAAAAAPGPVRLRFVAAEEVELIKSSSEPMGTTWAEGLRLASVTEGSPAQACGVARFINRRLTHINGTAVHTAEDVLEQRVVPEPDGSMRLRLRFEPALDDGSWVPSRVAALEFSAANSRAEAEVLRTELRAEQRRREAAEAALAATRSAIVVTPPSEKSVAPQWSQPV